MSLKGKLQSLQSHLDGAASINFRGDPDFQANTLRWSDFAAPQPGAVINVATENDVQKTVRGIRSSTPLSWQRLLEPTVLLTKSRSNGQYKMGSNLLLQMVLMGGR